MSVVSVLEPLFDYLSFTQLSLCHHVLTHIREWRWNDPVTLLYSEIFDENTIIEPIIDEETLQKDLEYRQRYHIPPSYKDRAKDDSGIGDLLIWQTILEIGRTRKKSVLFVSGDEKADWYLRSEGQALYPRYELIDEFKRNSEGQSFHIIKFSSFLELFGASKKIIQEVREEETQPTNPTQSLVTEEDKKLINSAINWLQSTYPTFQTIISTGLEIPDIIIKDTKDRTIGAQIYYIPELKDFEMSIKSYIFRQSAIINTYDAFIEFLVVKEIEIYNKTVEIISVDQNKSDMNLPNNLILIAAYQTGNNLSLFSSYPKQI